MKVEVEVEDEGEDEVMERAEEEYPIGSASGNRVGPATRECAFRQKEARMTATATIRTGKELLAEWGLEGRRVGKSVWEKEVLL